jgi:hypothetical protein
MEAAAAVSTGAGAAAVSTGAGAAAVSTGAGAAAAALADVDFDAFFSDGSPHVSPVKPTHTVACELAVMASSSSSLVTTATSRGADTSATHDACAAAGDAQMSGVDLEGFFSDGSEPASPVKPAPARARVAAVRARAAAVVSAAAAAASSSCASVATPTTLHSDGEYRRLLVLDVVAGQYEVPDSGNVRRELVLRAIDEQRTALVMCHLREDWVRTVVKPGDYIHVTGGGASSSHGDGSGGGGEEVSR